MDALRRFFLVLALGLVLPCSACSSLLPYKYMNIYRMTEPVVSTDKNYTDGKIDINFWIDEKKIHMRLKNLMSEEITIDWAHASYTHIDGGKHGVANVNSLFTEHRTDPAPTIVPPGETIDDYVAPVKNVEKLEQWTWYVYPLFDLFDDKAFNNKGKTFGVDIPIRTEGKWVTYKFRFEISNVLPLLRRV